MIWICWTLCSRHSAFTNVSSCNSHNLLLKHTVYNLLVGKDMDSWRGKWQGAQGNTISSAPLIPSPTASTPNHPPTMIGLFWFSSFFSSPSLLLGSLLPSLCSQALSLDFPLWWAHQFPYLQLLSLRWTFKSLFYHCVSLDQLLLLCGSQFLSLKYKSIRWLMYAFLYSSHFKWDEEC